MIHILLACIVLFQSASLNGLFAAEQPAADWEAGFARVVITPEEPMWLSGYGNRTKPAEGKIHDLYARAAALRSPGGKTVVFVSLDLIGVPAEMAARISRAVKERHGIERADLMLTCSHTHCGPALDDKLSHMLDMKEDDWAKVKAYQKQLDGKIIEAIDGAMEDLGPARLTWGVGSCGFAKNRRPPIGEGPTDHDVPVLQVTSPAGELRGVIFGYACHNTTMAFDFWFGDYAGVAQLYLEDRHPGAVALFHTGCGADQNPLPRREIELAEQYGRSLAVAVEEVLVGKTKPVGSYVATDFRTIDLAFDTLPGEEAIRKQLESGSRFEQARAKLLLAEIEENGKLRETYPYPVQVWRLGNELIWVALGGEIVVDYSLRLKQELGPERTWATGYANDVMAYIPSERVLKEGGYEGATSMVYYQLPTTWKPGLEDQIVSTVKELAEATAPPQP